MVLPWCVVGSRLFEGTSFFFLSSEVLDQSSRTSTPLKMQRHIPEERKPQSHRWENLRTCLLPSAGSPALDVYFATDYVIINPAAAHLLRSWVRIPPGAWIFVCFECRVLSGRGLCDELITRPEESYRLCCVVCDLETSNRCSIYI